MKRNLIKHGLSSLTVSLPSKYVKKHGLKKGMEVDVYEKGKSLIVNVISVKNRESISIDISGNEHDAMRILGACYKSGYDGVSVRFNKYSELIAVKKAIQSQFSGYEIIEQKKQSLKILKIGQDDPREFDRALRRFYHILSTMSTELLEASRKKDAEWIRSIGLMKYEADRLADYLRRSLNTGYQSSMRTGPLYTVIEQSEKIIDRIKEICDNPNKIRTFEAKMMQSIIADFIDMVIKPDIKKIMKLRQACEKLMSKGSIFTIIHDLNGPLMALNM